MSGPALRNVDSHSSIHEACLGEAQELTGLYSGFLRLNELDKALEIAYITVEHWESRTLQHALSEEEGLYKEALEAQPELSGTIAALTRDHNLMRFLVKEIRELMEQGASDKILQRFHALLLIDHYHNRDEILMIGHELGGSNHSAEQAG